MSSSLPRRTFLQQSGLLAGGMLLAGQATAPAADGSQELPQRVLGKTGVKITAMTLGSAPVGNTRDLKAIGECVNTAIDLGINSIDTAPAYVAAEEGIGLALGRRRKGVFLATKVLADDVEKAEKILSNSLKLLKTDYLDLVYFHQVGERKADVAMTKEGVFTWLLKQKKAGKIRFVGISGHNRPARCAQYLESGKVDVLLTVINPVDRFTYRYEEDVLPIARKNNVGIIAMKVFGGAAGMKYADPKTPPQLDVKYLPLAVRYAMGVPGVASLNLGVHTVEQVRQNIEMVKAYQKLSADEQEQLAALGKKLAPEWGEHFGPVVEKTA